MCIYIYLWTQLVKGKRSLWKWIYRTYYKLSKMIEQVKLHWYFKYIILLIQKWKTNFYCSNNIEKKWLMFGDENVSQSINILFQNVHKEKIFGTLIGVFCFIVNNLNLKWVPVKVLATFAVKLNITLSKKIFKKLQILNCYS